MEIMGIKIPTVLKENSAAVCAGCAREIDGTPFRMSILDTIAIEAAPSFGLASPINPGPFQFCSDPACPPTWAAARDWPVCQQSSVREIMRPIALGDSRHGLCDGIHRDAYEFLPA